MLNALFYVNVYQTEGNIGLMGLSCAFGVE